MNPYENYGMFFPQMPTTSVNVSPIQQYQPNYTSGPMSDLINKYGSQLAPMPAFTQRLAPNKFYKPFQETLGAWEKTFARPEYMTRTYQPFQRDWANQAAAGGLSQMGSGRKQYQSAVNQMESSYKDQMEQARSQMEGQVEALYQRRLAADSDSPTAYRFGGKVLPTKGGRGLF